MSIIHWLQEFYKWHPIFLGYMMSSVAALFVSTMPSPKPTDSPWYSWTFNLLHAIQLLIPRLLAQYKADATQVPKP